jgi:hypothetical protein
VKQINVIVKLEVKRVGELKNRAYLNTTIPIRSGKILREMSNQMRIPISRLTEEALNYLFAKHKNIVKDIEKNLPE